MSHSTNSGFSGPPAASTRVGPDEYRSFARWLVFRFLLSPAVGVGHRPCRNAVASVIALFAPDGLVPPKRGEERPPEPSLASGVGNNEEPKSEVRGTNGCRWYALPFRVVPEVGQVGLDIIESKGKVPWDVLQERPFGS